MSFNAIVAQNIAWLYMGAFGRPPVPSSSPVYNDPEGLAFWTNEFLTPSSPYSGNYIVIGDFFAGSPEFQQKYPLVTSNSQYVTQLYQNLLGRGPEPEGLQYWLDAMAGVNEDFNYAMSRGEVLARFTFETENRNAPINQNGAASFNSYIVALANETEDTWLAQNPLLDPATYNNVNGEQFILTTGQDAPSVNDPTAFVGGNGNDTFIATELTLQTGDILNGGGGLDTLSLSVNAVGTHYSAPTLRNIEVIRVNAPNVQFPQIEIDLSNSDGYNLLESLRVSDYNADPRSFVAFYDIRNANTTDISIQDTVVDHEFTYDRNAFLSRDGGERDRAGTSSDNYDEVDLTLKEVGVNGRGPNILLGIDAPYDGTHSYLDGVDIQSLPLTDEPNQTRENYVNLLLAGDFLNDVIIGGTADLEIEGFLDQNVTYVDASALTVDLTLDLLGRGAYIERDGVRTNDEDPTAEAALSGDPEYDLFLTVVGAQGDDLINVDAFSRSSTVLDALEDGDVYEFGANGIATLNTGNDTLRVGDNRDDGAHYGVFVDPDDYPNQREYEAAYEAAAGDGNDDLESELIGLGHWTIDAGAGNDVVELNIHGLQNIALGEGNDNLTVRGNVDDLLDYAIVRGAVDEWEDEYVARTVNAGSGNDTVWLEAHGDNLGRTGYNVNQVDLGDGNDRITILGHGYQQFNADGSLGAGAQDLTGGAGNDTMLIGYDVDRFGNVIAGGDRPIPVIADAGTGNDVIEIHGFGVHDIELGDGNDRLLIDGSRTYGNGFGNIDYSTDEDAMTTVRGGLGNDTVDVRDDHFLDLDLAEGNDLLILRAQDLTVDDVLIGGVGRDTLRLTNNAEFAASGVEIDASETDSTLGFEVFDLRNANITLALTNENFDSAENRFVTVNTHEAGPPTMLPEAYLPGSLVPASSVIRQGMSVEEFDDVAQTYFRNDNNTAGEARAALVEWLLDHGVTGVDFSDQTADGDSFVYTRAPASIAIEGDGPTFDNPRVSNTNDQVYFRMEPDGYQAVDITEVRLSLAAGRSFKLEGGNIRDILIADADSINSRSILEFDGPAGANQSVFDTLRVVDAATITAADLRNVSGLEIVELETSANQPVTWTIELSDRVINQTTGSAPLIIKVADEVPAGSILKIELDPSVHDGSLNDVQIIRNGNVQVFISDERNGLVNYLVTEDEYETGAQTGRDFDTGTYKIVVYNAFNQYEFTANTDRLIGSAANDEFVARSIDQIQTADTVDGGDGNDTVTLAFAVANAAATLEEQLNEIPLDSIEVLRFVTGNVVSMDGIGRGYAEDLETMITGTASDDLTNMRKDLTYELEAGNDEITLRDDFDRDNLSWGEDMDNGPVTTIRGGDGNDSVYGTDAPDHVVIAGVEYVDLGDPGFLPPDSDENDLPTGFDQVDLETANPAWVFIHDVEIINGSDGDDMVDAENLLGSIMIDGAEGDDHLIVNATSAIFVSPPPLPFSLTNSQPEDPRIDIEDLMDFFGEDGYDDTGVALVQGGLGNDSMEVDADLVAFVTGGDMFYSYSTLPELPKTLAGTPGVTARAEGNPLDGNDTIEVTLGFGDDFHVVSGWLPDVDARLGEQTWDWDFHFKAGASVWGEGGQDSIIVGGYTADARYGEAPGINWQANQYFSVDGGDGGDTISVRNIDQYSVTDIYGGGEYDDETDFDADDADSITLEASFAGMGYIWAGTANDTIDVSASDGYWHQIIGDHGDDEIRLGAATSAFDQVFFGDIGYPALQGSTPDNISPDFNNQGFDTITDFVFESFFAGGDPRPQVQDAMNFVQFLGGALSVANLVTNSGNWTGGLIDANSAAGNSVVVLASQGTTGRDGLTADDFSVNGGGIQLNNNGRAVVVVGHDGTTQGGGIQNFDIYFVQDIDSGLGQTWAVDLVAEVKSATRVGIESVMNNLLDGQFIAGVQDQADTFMAGPGRQLIDLFEGAGINMSVDATGSTGLTGAGAMVDIGDTLIYGDGIDTILGFGIVEDMLYGNTPVAGVTPRNLINTSMTVPALTSTGADLISDDGPAVLYGSWNAVTETFTIGADWSGSNNDALVFIGQPNVESIIASDNATLLVDIAGALTNDNFWV